MARLIGRRRAGSRASFVEEDQIEEVGGQIPQPAVVLTLQLLDVRHHHVGLFEVAPIGRPASNLNRLGEGGAARICTSR